jgi:5-methylcytosine-specific restriction endonuclease McrA
LGELSTMARQGNTTAVGLGYAHQRDRKRAIAVMPDGTQCPLCGRPMHKDPARNHDGRALHYDHVIARALGGHNGPRRLTHASCNEQAGRLLGARLARSRRRPRRAAYTRW